MRLWGIYIIPRDRAPDEGYHVTKTTRGVLGWRAHRLPGPQVPKGKPDARADSFDELAQILDDGGYNGWPGDDGRYSSASP